VFDKVRLLSKKLGAFTAPKVRRITNMISNERPSPYGNRSFAHAAPKPSVAEETLKIEKVQIERKTFVFTLKENPRGRFLRITEDVNGRRDAIIIPASGLEDFQRVLQEIIRVSSETQPQPFD
jgi:hypothetical protein